MIDKLAQIRTDLLGKFGAPVFWFRDEKHKRYRMDRYHKEGVGLECEIQYVPDGHNDDGSRGWLSIKLEERYPTKTGESSRVLSATLSSHDVATLRAYLNCERS